MGRWLSRLAAWLMPVPLATSDAAELAALEAEQDRLAVRVAALRARAGLDTLSERDCLRLIQDLARQMQTARSTEERAQLARHLAGVTHVLRRTRGRQTA